MQYVELIATVTGIIQGILIMLNKKSNWVFHLISNICLVVFSFYTKLYADGFETSLYVILSVWGLISWYKVKETHIDWCSNKERITYIAMILGLWAIIYAALLQTDDVSPLLDSFTTGSGLIATLMMANKRVESWIVWFVNDIVYVYLYFTLDTPALGLTVLNLLWVFMAVGSFITWSKEAKKLKEGVASGSAAVAKGRLQKMLNKESEA